MTALRENTGLPPFGMLLVVALLHRLLGFFIETLSHMVATIAIPRAHR